MEIGKNKKNNIKYSFIKDLTPKESKEHDRVGLYEYKKRRVIIKKHEYINEDRDYEMLVHEAEVMKVMHNLRLKDIIIPEVLGVENNKKTLSVMLEYVDGKTIFGLSEILLVNILKDCISYLKKSSKLFMKGNISISKRGVLYFIFTFPYYAVVSIVKNPNDVFFMSKFFFLFYFFLLTSNVFKFKLYLSHCELYQDSIIYNKKTKKIALIDWESAVLSDKLYDLALISRYYFGKISKKNMNKLYKKFINNRYDLNRLKALSIHGSLEAAYSRGFEEDYYEKTKKYLSQLVYLEK